jgi:hypothetical protein
MFLKPRLKEFLFTCIKKFTMYIWFLATRKIFARNLEIIIEKFGIVLLSSKILIQTLYFRNDQFLHEKFKKPIFHKNLDHFFHIFPSMTFENTLLVDYMPHKSMFNPHFNAMSSVTLFMGPIQTIIICSKSFSFTWNPCICLECGFINF